MEYQPIVPRARLGFIIPSSNRMVEPQLHRFAPDGVAVHVTRIGMTNRHRAPLDQLMPRILEATDLLSDSKVDVTVLQCTGTSMSGGVDGEQKVIAAMEQATGRPALSAASSLTAAFRTLGATRLVFVSETAQEGHDKKLGFLRQAGYDIVADKAMSLANSDAYCTTPPAFWFDSVRAMKNEAAEAYFVSCANIHSIDVIEALEAELDRPVVTSNQAALWCALRTAGIDDSISSLGRLGSMDLAPAAAAAE